jgi:hydroxymethylpyrimidine pyrophosphatase-like HAD family hydrolase|tara:strand:+ start:4953 stop:5345 length:393 start_codon:yes stop_codon:yes gene_type:complete
MEKIKHMVNNRTKKINRKIFLIDIDETICKTNGSNYSKSVPKKKMIRLVNLLKENGHYIKIYTARYMNRANQNVKIVNTKYYKKTFNQLLSWNLKFDELIMGKPSSDYIVDDRSFNPIKGNFDKFSKKFT